jgi:putative glycosyltransferase (TIGR04372 family)
VISFIYRQIKQIKKGGIPAVRRKIVLLITLHIPMYTTIILFSIPFLLIATLMRRFYLIRWQPIVSGRIGHLAGNLEMYCCEVDAGINVPNGKYIDIFYIDSRVANYQLLKMWRRILFIAPRYTSLIFNGMNLVIKRSSKIFPGLNAHIIGENYNVDSDVLNLLDKTLPHLKFTKDEKEKGRNWLINNNIELDAKIVLLMVRDSEYLNEVDSRRNWGYHDYRDCDIDNFIQVSEELVNKGYFVIRMGHHVKNKLNSQQPKVIDYATNGMRSDFMDIYLSSICNFVITTGVGIDAPAVYNFRKPSVYVNYCPAGLLHTYNDKILLLTKHHFLKRENREATLAEIFSSNVGFTLDTRQYTDNNIVLIENTPEEICDVTFEMVERLEGCWISTSEDEYLQAKFWEIFPVNSKSIDNGMPLHGEIRARYGSAFLRNNPKWIDEK